MTPFFSNADGGIVVVAFFAKVFLCIGMTRRRHMDRVVAA